MRMRAGTWVSGLVGSVAAHGVILAVLMVAIRPGPVSEQPLPPSEMEVQAYQLDRTEAREQRPESQRTRADTPDGTALGAGAIRQSRARRAPALAEPVQPDTTRPQPAREVSQSGAVIAPASPAADMARQAAPVVAIAQQPRPTRDKSVQVALSATSLGQAAPPATRLTQAERPQPRIVATRATPAVLTQAVAPPVAPLAAVVRSGSAPLPVAMPAIATVQTSRPVADTLPQAIAQPGAVPSVAPVSQSAPAQATGAARVRPSTPSAQNLKAALAFSGADGDVDPVSIAAFQSFMQPGDIGASGDQLRDGLAGLLAQVPCSRMQVAFDPDTATLQVNGHIPEDDLRAPVLAALRAQMGANITVSDNILILPRPQCGALSGIAGVGLPQSTDQITNPLVIGEDAQARVFSFSRGDLLSLDMTAPDYDAYIYLDYFDADGMVLHLEPNQYAPLRQAVAQSIKQIGAKTMQDSGLKLVIGPPFGQEIAVAFAASEPLYDGLRPIQEPAAEYLEWLKGQVARARAEHADFKGEWVYFFVSTADR